MPKRRRLSLEMHVEDRILADKLLGITTTLKNRHPNSVGIEMALRGLSEFAISKPPVTERKRKPKAAPIDVLAQRTLAELPQ